MTDEDDTPPSDQSGGSESSGDTRDREDRDPVHTVPEELLGASQIETGTVTPETQLEEWVGEADPERIATLLAALDDRLVEVTTERDALEAEVDELEERVKRVQADFQNYKKRTERRREEEQAQATRALVERLLPVRDNLERALDQDADVGIRDGVEATLGELDEVLASEDVEAIEPSQGDPVDPQRHEVLHREDEESDTISTLFRRGYEMGDAVIRPAQVTVGAGTASDEQPASDEPE
jgi:molecular chaperone GrpE